MFNTPRIFDSNQKEETPHSIERDKGPLSNRHEVLSRTPFVRDLPYWEGDTPSQLTPQKQRSFSWSVTPSTARNLLSFCLWVELEEGTFPSSTERRRPLTAFGVTEERRRPLTSFGVTKQRCHVERSEKSPIQSKGGTDPFRTYPIKDLKPFGGVLRGILLTPSIG